MTEDVDVTHYWNRYPGAACDVESYIYLLYGFMSHGFPNFFMVSIAQAGAAVNYVHTADEQTKTIVHVITEAMRRGVEAIQPTKAAESAWVEEIAAVRKAGVHFSRPARPGYYNYEGKRERYAALNDFYAPGPMAYIRLLDAWRQKARSAGIGADTGQSLSCDRQELIGCRS